VASDLDNKLNKIRDKIDEVSDTIYKIDKEVALQKASFDEHTKQDELMYSQLKRMNDILQENTLSLKEHMSQTMLLRDMVVKMDARMAPLEIKHIEDNAIKHFRRDKLILILKVLGAIAALASAGVAAKPLIIKWLL
jgi:hypothetical protein